MDKKIKLIITALLLSLGLSSCGDLFMKKKNNEGLSFNEALTCSFDAKVFGEIMKQDISSSIECLKGKLHTFIDLVKTDKPGYISEVILIKFIKTGAIEIGEGDITPIIKSIFDLTHVIMGGQRGYISRADLDRLIDFLKKFNQNIHQVYDYFTREEPGISFDDYQLRQSFIVSKLNQITRDLSILLKTSRTTVDQIDIDSFLDSFFAEDPELAEKIRSLMFLKRMFLGGNKKYLTYIELHRAIGKVGRLGVVGYDLVKLNSFKFTEDPRKLVEVYAEDLKHIGNVIHFGSDSNELQVFALRDIADMLDTLEIDTYGIDPHEYLKELTIIKNRFFSTGSASGGAAMTAKELHQLVYDLTEMSKQSAFFYRVYEHYKVQLNAKVPISIDFDKYPLVSLENKKYLDRFAKIVHNYKFFKGSSASAAVFNYKYERSASGVVEIGMIEYLSTMVMQGFGEKNAKARGGWHMTLDQTIGLVEKLRFILKDQGIIKIGRKDSEGNIPSGVSVKGAAENFVLMSTLFQYQSDGCNKKVCMEVPELTEFLVGLMTSLSVRDFFTRKMEVACGVASGDSFPVSCFRKNFVKVMHEPVTKLTITGKSIFKTEEVIDGRSLADYLPEFSKYLDQIRNTDDLNVDPTNATSYNKFLVEMEAFTRTCGEKSDGTSIDMKGSDAFGVFAGLLNLEATLLRFDKNQDGVMNGKRKSDKEVMAAYYEVYEGAIKSLVAKNGGFMEKLAKPVFKYLVKEGKAPDQKQFKSVWAFIKFMVKFNKRADASRTTIATILKTLGQQSDTSKLYPFDCDNCIEKDCQADAGNYWNRGAWDSEPIKSLAK